MSEQSDGVAGVPVIAEVFAWDEVDRLYDRLQQLYDRNLDTIVKARARRGSLPEGGRD